jgi:antitoxin MazE
MHTRIINIGNSRGIRIPGKILKALAITDDVDLTFDEHKQEIIIRPIRKPRHEWDKAFKEMNHLEEDRLLIDDSLDAESEQWEW